MVNVFIADMSAQAEVRRLAAEVLGTYPRIDVLVNNVGGLWAGRHVTVDGLERSLALNHLGPFLLTRLLIDRLKSSAPARVVTVSSRGHAKGRIDFDDLQAHSGERAYEQSKLANVMFTYALARRLDGTGVTANVLDPGMVATAIGDDDPMWFMPVVRVIGRTPEKGAATSVHLASSPEVEGVTGKYFVNCKPRPSSELSYDKAAAERLWKVSEELVGLAATL